MHEEAILELIDEDERVVPAFHHHTPAVANPFEWDLDEDAAE